MIARARSSTLGPQSFDRILLLLDADHERAGEKYELIRTRLVRIFEWRGCQAPETIADETFDRVGRRLEQGEQVRAADSAVYFYGVARNVSNEYRTDQRKGMTARISGRVSQERLAPASEDEERDARLDCLDRCLAQMPRDSRELIERYYRSNAS